AGGRLARDRPRGALGGRAAGGVGSAGRGRRVVGRGEPGACPVALWSGHAGGRRSAVLTKSEETYGGGRYTIVAQVGTGGMGAVYRAQQKPLGRQVALKVLKPEFSRHVTVRRRFSREARAVAAL